MTLGMEVLELGEPVQVLAGSHFQPMSQRGAAAPPGLNPDQWRRVKPAARGQQGWVDTGSSPVCAFE